ncbi:hypothetical protein [Rhodanobacter lindaniclasticus]
MAADQHRCLDLHARRSQLLRLATIISLFVDRHQLTACLHVSALGRNAPPSFAATVPVPIEARHRPPGAHSLEAIAVPLLAYITQPATEAPAVSKQHA